MDCKGTHFFWNYNIYGIFFSLFRPFSTPYSFFFLIEFSILFWFVYMFFANLLIIYILHLRQAAKTTSTPDRQCHRNLFCQKSKTKKQKTKQQGSNWLLQNSHLTPIYRYTRAKPISCQNSTSKRSPRGAVRPPAQAWKNQAAQRLFLTIKHYLCRNIYH